MSDSPSHPEAAALAAARAVRTREDLVDALERIAGAIAAALRSATVVLHVHRPAWDDFEVATVHGPDAVRRNLLGQVSTWEHWAPRLNGDDEALVSALYAANGDVLGLLVVDAPTGGSAPTDQDRDRLEALSAITALALERATDCEREVRHRAALDRLRDLAALPPAARRRDDVLHEVCAAARYALGFGRTAALLAENGGLLRPVAVSGWTLHDPVFAHMALTLEQLKPLLSAGYERQGCYLIEREDAEATLGLDGESLYRSQTSGHGPYAWRRHWLLVPLRDAVGDVRGVLWLDDPADRLVPTREWLQLLALLADQGARSLDGGRAAGGPAGPVLGAEQDPLTGLATRAKLADRLRHALQRVKRAETTVAVLFIDLDNFHHVNDTLGHSAGDELLRAGAARIDEDLRPGDTVARFGGDEFVVLCEDVGSAQDALDVAERLRALLSEPIPVATGVVQVTASIGVALPDRPDRSAEALLQAADRAMYEAKAAGRDASRLASPGAGWP